MKYHEQNREARITRILNNAGAIAGSAAKFIAILALTIAAIAYVQHITTEQYTAEAVVTVEEAPQATYVIPDQCTLAVVECYE